MARSFIALSLDVEPTSFDVAVEIEAIEDLRVSELKDQLDSSRAELEAAQHRYRDRLRDAAVRLAGQGLPVRDIGVVLTVSHQRAAQVLDEAVKARFDHERAANESRADFATAAGD